MKGFHDLGPGATKQHSFLAPVESQSYIYSLLGYV
jgi:hypothetical protein